MAIEGVSLTTTGTQPKSLGYKSYRQEPKAFAATAAPETYGILTPITIEPDGHCVVWAVGQQVHGFVVQFPVITSTTGEIMGTVLIKGEVNAEQLNVPDGQALPDLLAELRNAYVQSRGIIVENLAGKL